MLYGANFDDAKENFCEDCVDMLVAAPPKKRLFASLATPSTCFSPPFLESDATRSNLGMPSPSPSPVFMDEDSHDSGYGCSQQGKFDGFEMEIKRRSVFKQHSMTSLKVWCEEQENDEMDVDMLDGENCATTMSEDSPFASLKTWREKSDVQSFKLRDSTNVCRRKQSFTTLKVPNANSHFNRCRSESEVGALAILQAMQKADDNTNLIGDFTNGHALPLLKNPKVPDMKCISGQTVCDILKRKFDDVIEKFVLIDCRYPYEYVGGHIRNAVNIYTQQQLRHFLDTNQSWKQSSSDDDETCAKRRTVFLFYCEFSKERGPRMCRHLRASDRQENQYRYPVLDYPELYLVEGGYKNFYAQFQRYCDPSSYKPMDHAEHADDLRKFRIKSKSWSSFAVAGASSFGAAVESTSAVDGRSPSTNVQSDTPYKAPLVRRGLFRQLDNL